ncbi:MAG: L-rhamnose mutarotase [Candidatus Limnocylindrales bacterium]
MGSTSSATPRRPRTRPPTPGGEAEYRRRHADVWSEMLAALKAAGCPSPARRGLPARMTDRPDR